jgi:hypothetical protein
VFFLVAGVFFHDSRCSFGRKDGPPSRVVQRVQQGSSYFVFPRRQRPEQSGRQAGQVHGTSRRFVQIIGLRTRRYK